MRPHGPDCAALVCAGRGWACFCGFWVVRSLDQHCGGV